MGRARRGAGVCMHYIPNTDADRAVMLQRIGLQSVEALFTDIPEALRRPPLDLPEGLPEMSVRRLVEGLAAKNAHVGDYALFLGAGAYHHYTPPVVRNLAFRSEFLTSYTPYQPEISQGTLHAVFEFQTLVCQLTGMDVANAAMYDGSTAMAEAALMAVTVKNRTRIVVLPGVHPEYRQVLRTYSSGLNVEIVEPPQPSGRATFDPAELAGLVDDRTACVIVQQPNFLGSLEAVEAISAAAKAQGALLVAVVDPSSLALLRPPGDYGADIVVGEAQSLGVPLSYGGPYVGIFACRSQYVRLMPGRIVGETVDSKGQRAYVLTLRTREQDIRREKATSNICTATGLIALIATIYSATLGRRGLRQVAEQSVQKAHYAARRIAEVPGYALPFASEPFYAEFVVRCPRPPAEINRALIERKIIGGFDLGRYYPDLKDCMLLCCTETNSREEINALVSALGEIGR